MSSEEKVSKDCSLSSAMDNTLAFDIDAEPSSVRLTNIVCTIGPSCNEVEVLVEMIQAGMNVLRLNLAHGKLEEHAETLQYVREAIGSVASEEDTQVTGMLAIAVDTKGPSLRTGKLKEDSHVELEKGQTIKLTSDAAYAEGCTSEFLYVDYKDMASVLAPKNLVYVDHELICLEVKSIDCSFVECEVVIGGRLGSRKTIHFPGVKVDLPALSERDKMDIRFAMDNEVDMIFASCIRSAAGVKEVRKVLGEEGKSIKVISKIENHEGVQNINEIIDASDGIMIARGNLGIDLPAEKVFLVQKKVIAKCNVAGKPVICANQLLESMVRKPRPTRAEGVDVANAVLDGADCVQLSCETAEGEFPVAAVQVMASICVAAETAIDHRARFADLVACSRLPADPLTATAAAAVEAALNCRAKAVVVLTRTGSSAKIIAKYHPPCPILAITRDACMARQILIHRAVVPLVYEGEEQSDWRADVEKQIQFAVEDAKGRKMVKIGDHVVIVFKKSEDHEHADTVSLMEIQ